jgi:hypothetical protein
MAIGVAVAALAAIAPAAHGAQPVGPARTVGSKADQIGPPLLAVTEGGRIALAAGATQRLYVVTRGRSGAFSPLREVPLKGFLPQVLGSPLPYLALDESGRMMTLEYRVHKSQTDPLCCNWPVALRLDSKARIDHAQRMAPRDRATEAVMASNRRGRTALMTFTGHVQKPDARLFTGSPNATLGSVKPPKPRGSAVVYAGPERLLVWDKDPQEAAYVFSGSGKGDWSPPRLLGRAQPGGAADGVYTAFGPNDRTLVVWHVLSGSFGTHTLHAAWMDGDLVTRRQTIATLDPNAPYAYSLAVDGSGRGTIVWVDGKRSVKSAHASAGGKFASPQLVWRAPEGRAVTYLGADGRPSGAIASWLAYPSVAGAGPETVRAVRIDMHGAAGAVQTVDTAAAKSSIYGTQVRLDANGAGAVAWLERTGAGSIRFRIALVR